MLLSLLLLASCAPEFVEVSSGSIVCDTSDVKNPSSFTLSVEDAGRLNAWLRENRSRFFSDYASYAPHRSVDVNGFGRMALTGDEESLILVLVNEKIQALQHQYVLRIEAEDKEILKLQRLKD